MSNIFSNAQHKPVQQSSVVSESHCRQIVVALAGNPNSGKTTIFNSLTGARQHVGNYPGVTVEHKSGSCRHRNRELQIVDLPGTYSLTAYSVEERVARNFIIDEKPDVVVGIVDSTNLERNLYLAVQILELGAPMVLAFNMSDTARSLGYEFDQDRLSKILRAPIVATVGRKGEGMQELKEAVLAVSSAPEREIRNLIDYGPIMEKELLRIQSLFSTEEYSWAPVRWLAIKMLEKDEDVVAKCLNENLLVEVEKGRNQIESQLDEDTSTVIACKRYEFIADTCRETVKVPSVPRRAASDRADSILTHRYLGLPLFLLVMYVVFQLTFTVSAAPMRWIEAFSGWLGAVIGGFWSAGTESPLRSLLIDGVIGGVGGVLVFMPNILCLFLAIAILEDSGYMARAALIMDRLMHKIGLHGKSFIPMLIGFGCSIPAIMATRTLENRRDRLATMLVIPLMSCGARLPIYSLLIPAFFPAVWRAPMLWLIYIIGILLAVTGAKLLRSTILKGDSVPFLMELPPYRIPTLKSVFIHMWERGWMYIKKAGTVILGLSILLWAMTSYPKKPVFDRAYAAETQQVRESALKKLKQSHPNASLSEENLPDSFKAQLAQIKQAQKSEELSYSITGRLGRFLEPALQPLGFDWRIGTALIGAFAAREVFVAQMGIAFSVGDTDENTSSLQEKLRTNYSPLAGFCVMLFCLIGTPCMATFAATRKESESWGWPLFQWAGLTFLAYALTLIVYQLGRLITG